MHRIVIDLNDLDSAIRDVKAYAKMVSEVADGLVYTLAEEAQRDAKAEYSTYTHDTDHAEVTLRPNDYGNGYVVSASAHDNKGRNVILFEEFGAGDSAGGTYADLVGAWSDSYSITHKQMYHRYGYWWYRRQRLTEVFGTYAMSEAAIWAKNSARIQAIASDLFAGRSF